jgi:hypothetical protein
VDSRQVAEQMVADSLDFPWYRDFERDMGRRPVIAVGPVQNRTPDYIDTQLFTKDIEREFIRGGDVRVVAMPEERQPLIDEVLNQQEVASVETAKRLKQMLGADFFLMGRIGAIIQRSPDGEASDPVLQDGPGGDQPRDVGEGLDRHEGDQEGRHPRRLQAVMR